MWYFGYNNEEARNPSLFISAKPMDIITKIIDHFNPEAGLREKQLSNIQTAHKFTKGETREKYRTK